MDSDGVLMAVVLFECSWCCIVAAAACGGGCDGGGDDDGAPPPPHVLGLLGRSIPTPTSPVLGRVLGADCGRADGGVSVGTSSCEMNMISASPPDEVGRIMSGGRRSEGEPGVRSFVR